MAASADPFLPIAPARVKALVLPIGNIKPARFASFLGRLTSENVVHLRDITPDSRPNRNMFSPLAFPPGAIFYDLVTHVPSPSHLALAPFDLYRQPLVIIAVADGLELSNATFCKRQSASGRSTEERNIRALTQELEDLRDEYTTRILVYQAMIFDYTPPESGPIPMPEGIVAVPPVEQSKRTTMKTAMCDVSSLLLAEMETLARSFEGLTFIDSPGQSSQARQLNGSSAGWENDPAAHARRNSQYATPPSRSASAAGALDRNQARMSMPVMPKGGGPFSSSSSTPARPSTPVRSGLSNPPTNFDELSNGGPANPTSPEQQGSPRPGTAEGFRTQSQDRISTTGFGSGGASDRWRSKVKGRLAVIIGSLYLQAGRWTDALRELADGATVAKSINDHLWHGKALDLIVISLTLLGWAGIEFTVPMILMPLQEKNNNSIQLAQEAAEKADPEQPKWMRTMQVILPELMDRIIALYSRISAEHLPPLPLAETTLRFCKLLSSLHICDGKLGKEALAAMVEGKLPSKVLTTSPRITIVPSRTQIVNTLFRAFPSTATELLTTIDRIVILSGIASVLGVLGFQRKKALVVRELVSVLIGGLVEARTRGAADVGIHPAAGLVGLNSTNGQTNGAAALELAEDDIESGVDEFLQLLLDTYGVVGYDMGTTEKDDSSDEATIAGIQRHSKARAFGMQSVKLNILRACINFSEALPDFNGVLKFSSDLLRTAGSGVAPGPRREDASANLTREEQVRLMTNISKTSSLSQKLGFGEIRAEYWDEFLLRGVKLEPLSPTRIPVEHKKSELPGASATRASQDVDPFLHNPFLKPPGKAAIDQTLVAGESATFKLTLQNPYDIEIDVESVQLDCSGATFESATESTIIGPYRTQVMRISGTPTSAGSLNITGAHIQIRGCRRRRFPIFPQPWSPEPEPKIKAIGLSALSRHLAEPTPTVAPLKPEHVTLNVIAAQPTIIVKSSTLPQSSLMILEGERRTFSVTLQNTSTVPADFLLFSFRDSTQEALQGALARRDASPAELYEYELILARKQALRIKQRKGDKGKSSRFIGVGEEVTFDFEILGKPGLTDGAIQVDYAHLGVPPDEIEGVKFWTRRVSLGLTITVNASVEVVRMDVLPLNGAVPRSLWQRTLAGSKTAEDDAELSADEWCLLVLDLRNAWPSHMAVQIDSSSSSTSPTSPTSPSKKYAASITEQILPGNSSRIILPLRRIHVADPHAPIPALSPARQRQFVVSSIAPEAERSVREAFWYREGILDGLRGEWRTVGGAGGERKGVLELRAMKLAPRMIEAVRVEEMGVEIAVQDAGAEGDDGEMKTVFTDAFLQLRVMLTNRSAHPIHPTVRLTPSLCHRPPNVALDHTRKFAWNGALQQALGEPVGPGEKRSVVVGVTPLCRGEFEIVASVEELVLWEEEEDSGGKEGGGKGRPRSGTQTMMDEGAIGKKERRIWHSRRACRVVVVDPPEE